MAEGHTSALDCQASKRERLTNMGVTREGPSFRMLQAHNGTCPNALWLALTRGWHL